MTPGGPVGVPILVADANEHTRRILAQALGGAGYRILDAPTPKVALVKALQFRPRLILLDYSTGLTVQPSYGDPLYPILILRQNGITADIPILVKCPVLDEAQVEALLSAGASEILFKPLKLKQLLALLKQHLGPGGESPKARAEARPIEAQKTLEEREQLLRSTQAMVSEKLEAAVGAAKQLLAFPFVVARALQISADDISGAQELGECISSDSAISAGLLKVANTVYFARRSGRIADLSEAIVRIGFRETRKLVICMSTFKLFQGPARSEGFSRMDFWLHALATAVIAEGLAEHARLARPGEVFVAGLFHDIGKILLDDFFPTVLDDVLQSYIEDGSTFEAAEKEIMGFGHGQLGASLLESWNLPENIRHAAFYHHELDRAAAALTGEKRTLVDIVATANLMAKALGLGHGANFAFQELPPEHWKRLGLERGLPRDFLGAVGKQIEMFCELLELPVQPVTAAATPVEGQQPLVWVSYDQAPGVSLVELALRSQPCRIEVRARLSDPQPLAVPELVIARVADAARARFFAEGRGGRALVLIGEPIPDLPAVFLSPSFHLLELKALVEAHGVRREGPAPTDPAERQREIKRLTRAASRLAAGANLEELDQDFQESIQALRERESRKDSGARAGSTVRGSAALAPPSTPASGRSAASTQAPSPLAQKAVLCIDAGERDRDLLQQIMQRAGFLTLSTRSAEEALGLLARHPRLDILILDPDLPALSGLELIARLRADSHYARLPVIICSLRHDRETVMSAARLGVRDYIAKPIEPTTFIDRVWRVLSGPPKERPAPTSRA